MPISGNNFSLPLTIAEVARFFGVAARSDGRYHLSDICASENINMFCKDHPVIYDSPAKPSESVRKTLNYGLVPPEAYGTAEETKSSVWRYNRPTLGLSRTFAKSTATGTSWYLNAIYDESMSEVSQVVIAAGATRTVVFDLPTSILIAGNGDVAQSGVTTGQEISITITFYMSGESVLSIPLLRLANRIN